MFPSFLSLFLNLDLFDNSFVKDFCHEKRRIISHNFLFQRSKLWFKKNLNARWNNLYSDTESNCFLDLLQTFHCQRFYSKCKIFHWALPCQIISQHRTNEFVIIRHTRFQCLKKFSKNEFFVSEKLLIPGWYFRNMLVRISIYNPHCPQSTHLILD